MSGRQRSEGGDSLVEILVALAVLSIGIVSLTAGLATNISTTVVNRDASQAESVLTAASEYVKGLSSVPFACSGSPTPITNAQVPHDAAYTVTYGPAAQVGTTACAELIRLPVRVTGNGFDLTVDVVKRP